MIWMKQQVLKVLLTFIFFWLSFDKNKNHSSCWHLVNIFLSHEKIAVVIAKYNQNLFSFNGI